MTTLRFAMLAPLALAATVAHADNDRYALSPAYVQECGACHVAYPPGLLPAASWQRLMQNLPKHFGTDASLDAATTAQLASWLAAHAATGPRARIAPPEDRITRSGGFVREHREVPPDAWTRASIKSASNCSACHARAGEGDFDEHRVRIPR
jgi:Dihaem cytochrome c